MFKKFANFKFGDKQLNIYKPTQFKYERFNNKTVKGPVLLIMNGISVMRVIYSVSGFYIRPNLKKRSCKKIILLPVCGTN
jgi:hypothetical protein